MHIRSLAMFAILPGSCEADIRIKEMSCVDFRFEVTESN